jgi:hypothetical protein
MHAIRAFFRRHATLAILIAVLALGVRVLMPNGYMAASGPAGFTVTLCGGGEGQSISIALLDGKHHGAPDKQQAADKPCAFSGLGFAAVPAIDPFLLALAIAFIMAIGTLPRRSFPRPAGLRLRPPLRGPPAIA